MNKAAKRKKTFWINPKQRGVFKGAYERDRAGERVFTLTGEKGRKITFESYQAALGLGWKKGEA